MAVNLRERPLVAGAACELRSAGLLDQCLEQAVLKLAVCGYRTARVENREKNWTAIPGVEDSGERAHSTIGCRQSSGLPDNCSAIVFGSESRTQRSDINPCNRHDVFR